MNPVGSAWVSGTPTTNAQIETGSGALATELFPVAFGGDGYALYLYAKREMTTTITAYARAATTGSGFFGADFASVGSIYSAVAKVGWTAIPFTPPATVALAFDVTNGDASFASVDRACNANIATITTSAAHGMSAGDTVTIWGMTDGTYDVSNATVLSVPLITTFTYALTHADELVIADALGTITPFFQYKLLLKWGG